MTYAIGELVYGINLQAQDYGRNDQFKAFRSEIDELVEADVITTSYSGSGDEPCYFGVRINSISEGDNLTGSQIGNMLDPTSAQIDEYNEKLVAFLGDMDISVGLRKIVEESVPGVFLTWGSS